MEGFGKSLTAQPIETKLFRKVSFENFSRNGELCFSTEKSVQLIGQGDFALVLESSEYNGMYANGDADAGKNYGYDEFRVCVDDIASKIIDIVVPDSWIDAINDENWAGDESEDPAQWIENIMSELGIYIQPLSATEGKEIYGIDFNF